MGIIDTMIQNTSGMAIKAIKDNVIIPQEKNDKFENASKFTFGAEGGYTVDNGGPTNFGITQNTLDAYNKSKNLPFTDVKNIKPELSKQIAREMFFDGPGYGSLPGKVSTAVFDFGFNASPRRSTSLLQTIVGAKPDGINGPKTLAAVDNYVKNYGEDMLVKNFINGVNSHYMNITNNEPPTKRRNGYMNRVASIKKYIGIE